MTGFLNTKRVFFSWMMFLVAISLSSLSSGGDPDRVFFTIKTEHFNIHYEIGLEHTARELAVVAEEIHNDLSVVFNWEIKKRTEVVIVDSTDSANGSASVMGKPVIRLYATAPTVESSLQSHDHWLRALFVHEYAHIVHLNIRGHFPDFFNNIFGDIYLPNQMSPRWFIEGLAVLIETHQTSSGRIRSSLFRMYTRTAALEDTLLNLGQVSNNTRQYLRGSHSYIYGAMFLEYIYQKFGMEKIVAFCHEYGKAIVPYGLNRLFRKIFGQDVQELYNEWVASEKKAAEKVKAELAEEGLTDSTALTSDGEDKGTPLFEAGGKSILLPIDNGMEDTALYRLSLDGKRKSGVVYSGVSSQISKDRNGRLFYTRSAPYKNYYNFADLFVLEGEDASPRRLTVGRRARYAAVSPGGDKVALTVNDAGTSKLTLTDEQGRLLDVLIDSPLDDQVFSPAWSPDGRQIAVVIRSGIKPDLALLDVATKKIIPITNDRFIENNPSFTADGRYIVFSSDLSGIPNIYAFDLSERKLLKITNVLSGASSPAVSDDGKTLAFLKYSSKGYDLHVTPFDPRNAKVVEDVVDPFPRFEMT
jgi:Tol biopolymer transport system component